MEPHPPPRRTPPGLLIAAPRSGSGKTLVTLGLLRALRAAGVDVRPFKCGPDYIDGAFHRAASGRDSANLDAWGMRAETLDALVRALGAGGDLILAEGLMGLFDGVEDVGVSGHGSSAEIAARFGWPVVLVADVSGQSGTAAASLAGFVGHREGVAIAGVILNRVGSARHRRLCEAALAERGIEVFGALPRETAIALPERHLGLVQAGETDGLDQRLDAIAAFVAAHVDLDRLRAAARGGGAAPAGRLPRPPAQRIALAADSAFSFVYPHLLLGWRAAGAEILPFSPLADEAPPAGADLVWLPGGYPELHSELLSNNHRFLNGLRAFSESGPVHGECGGYMVLGETLTDAQGRAWPMAGLLSLRTSFAERRLHLGYRRGRLEADSPIGPAGSDLTGHEFHYATTIGGNDAPLLTLTDSRGERVAETGGRRGRVSGSFFHLVDRID
jgi:cobyrinic acid a,c-diamide synthase